MFYGFFARFEKCVCYYDSSQYEMRHQPHLGLTVQYKELIVDEKVITSPGANTERYQQIDDTLPAFLPAITDCSASTSVDEAWGLSRCCAL